MLSIASESYVDKFPHSWENLVFVFELSQNLFRKSLLSLTETLLPSEEVYSEVQIFDEFCVDLADVLADVLQVGAQEHLCGFTDLLLGHSFITLASFENFQFLSFGIFSLCALEIFGISNRLVMAYLLVFLLVESYVACSRLFFRVVSLGY